jgi:hypothetical protein
MCDQDNELARGVELLCAQPLISKPNLAMILAASRGAGRECPRAQAAIARRLALAARAAERDAGEARSLLSAGAGKVLVKLLNDFAPDLESTDDSLRAGRRVCAHAASALADLASSRLGAAAKAAIAAEGAIEALLDTLAYSDRPFVDREAESTLDPTDVSCTQACRAIGNLSFGLDDSGASACKSRFLLYACRSCRLSAESGGSGEDAGPAECACVASLAPARHSGACGADILAAALRRTVPVRGRGRSAAACRWALHSIASVTYGRAPNRAQTLIAGAGALGDVMCVIAAAAAAGAAAPRTSTAVADGASTGGVAAAAAGAAAPRTSTAVADVAAECNGVQDSEPFDDLDDRVVAAALTALANLVFRHDANRVAAQSAGNVVADTERVLARRLSIAASSPRSAAVVEAALFALASLLGDAGACAGGGRAGELAAMAAACLPGSRIVQRWAAALITGPGTPVLRPWLCSGLVDRPRH